MVLYPTYFYFLWALEGVDSRRQPVLDQWHYSKRAAYEHLKADTGQDFGYNVEEWRQWIKANEDVCSFSGWRRSDPQIWLDNMKGLDEVRRYSLEHFIPFAQAYSNLKEYVGQDFGIFDITRWSEWFAINKPDDLLIFPPGYDYPVAPIK